MKNTDKQLHEKISELKTVMVTSGKLKKKARCTIEEIREMIGQGVNNEDKQELLSISRKLKNKININNELEVLSEELIDLLQKDNCDENLESMIAISNKIAMIRKKDY